MSPRPPITPAQADWLVDFEKDIGEYAAAAVMSKTRRASNAQRRAPSFTEFRRLQRVRSGEQPEKPSPEARSIWWRYATDKHPQFTADEIRVLSKGTGSAGGYLVPSDFFEEVAAVARDQGSVAKVAKEIRTADGRSLLYPEVSAYGSGAWTSESASYTVGDDTFGLLTLNAFKGEALSLVSEELLRDSGVSLDSFLADEFGGRLAALEGAAFVNGDGVGKPQGALANFPVVTAPTGSSTSFTLTDFVEALHTVALPYRNQSGAWIVADGVLKSLRKAVRATGTGDPFFVDPDTPDEPPMLLGYPIFADTNMPAPAANAKSVMFAGWQRAYVIRRVIGLETKRLDEAYAANGQVGFLLKERLDGRVIFSAAGVALQHSAT